MDSTFFFFFEKVWEGRGLEGFKAGIGKKPFLIYNSVGGKQEGEENFSSFTLLEKVKTSGPE